MNGVDYEKDNIMVNATASQIKHICDIFDEKIEFVLVSNPPVLAMASSWGNRFSDSKKASTDVCCKYAKKLKYFTFCLNPEENSFPWYYSKAEEDKKIKICPFGK